MTRSLKPAFNLVCRVDGWMDLLVGTESDVLGTKARVNKPVIMGGGRFPVGNN